MSDATPPDEGPNESTPAETDDSRSAVERKIRRALREVRREGWKVAVVYATVDAALATLLVNLAGLLVGVPGLPPRLPVPGAILGLLESLGQSLAEPTVASAAVAGLAVGAVVFVTEVAWRVRRPLVEQFEAANPDLREALRTARDAVRDDRRSRMALRLYEEVLADLREASSAGLLDLRRVAATLVLVSVLSVATVHLAVVDVSLAGLGGPASPDGPGGGTESDYAGLQNGSSILGEPEDVPEGEEELDAAIDTSGSGSGAGTDVGAGAYENSGFQGVSAVERQRAAFDERERLEDAELIREYNLRIRQEDT